MNALEFHAPPSRFIVASDGVIFDARREAKAQMHVTLGPKNSPVLAVLDATFYDECTDEADADLDAFITDMEGMTFAAIALGRIGGGNSGMGGAL